MGRDLRDRKTVEMKWNKYLSFADSCSGQFGVTVGSKSNGVGEIWPKRRKVIQSQCDLSAEKRNISESV